MGPLANPEPSLKEQELLAHKDRKLLLAQKDRKLLTQKMRELPILKEREQLLNNKEREQLLNMKEREQLLNMKERALLQGSGSVSGSPGRLYDNVSRDSGVGGLKEGLNTSGESENDIPKYILDNNDKTSYFRGKFLGKGGFARVHELIDLRTKSVVAGKIIHKSRVSKPHHREKIAREIELHRSLCHRNVVQFLKHFEDGENIYIVLEYCARRSLVHVLKARHVVTEPETRFYMSQLVQGVEYIHSQNIIHRDLKLGNLFLTNSMAVKIGDFGLATRLGLEKKGTLCGTPNYISPEVLNKEGHGFQADVWALGCVMYALLVGQPPFETATLKETYSRIAENIYTIPENLSPAAGGLIQQLLHPDPLARPSLRAILRDPYFTTGYFPTSLPVTCCTSPPVFPPHPPTPTTTYHQHTNANLNHNNANHVNNNVFLSADKISKLTSSVHNLALPDPPAGGGGGGVVVVVTTPATSPMIWSPPTPSSSSYRSHSGGGSGGSSGSMADLSGGGGGGGAAHTSVSIAASLPLLLPSSSSSKSASRPSSLMMMMPPQQQQQQQPLPPNQPQPQYLQHTVVSLLGGGGPLKIRKTSMYESLVAALSTMPKWGPESGPSSSSLPLTQHCPTFITKWIDYSNKYGFGFQLSDRSVGVLFNDLTCLIHSADRSFIQFSEGGSCISYSAHHVPLPLEEKFSLLRYLASYMDERLTEGGVTTAAAAAAAARGANRTTGVTRSTVPQIKRWIRTEKACIMLLTSGTIQVNYFKDHTKLIVGCLDTPRQHLQQQQQQHIVTFINSERQSRSWYLSDLGRWGASVQVRERMSFVANVLKELEVLDGKQMCFK